MGAPRRRGLVPEEAAVIWPASMPDGITPSQRRENWPTSPTAFFSAARLGPLTAADRTLLLCAPAAEKGKQRPGWRSRFFGICGGARGNGSPPGIPAGESPVRFAIKLVS